MKIKTALNPARTAVVQAIIDALPDWAYITDNPLLLDAKWTTRKGVWAVRVEFQSVGMGSTLSVSGRGLEMKYGRFTDDDATTVVATLGMLGAFSAMEGDDA